MITIPTIATIRAQIIADIESQIGQTIPALPRAFFRVVASALAGVLYLIYRFGAWVYDQIFPQTADTEALKRIGEEYGIFLTPARAAILYATATGTPGETIAAGTLWQSDGIVYVQDVAALIDIYGEASIIIEALTKGDNTNLIDGAVVSLVTPQAGVDPDATIYETELSGEDAEDIEAYRARVSFRLANRPQGGAAADYIAWAQEVPGIVKAFAFRTNPGEVTVYPLQSLTADRIPDYTKLSEVEDYLQDTIRRPLCANVEASAMTERVFNIVVTTITPDSVAMRAAIEEAWESFLLSRFPAQYSGLSTNTDFVARSSLYKEAAAVGANVIEFELYLDDDPYTPITFHQLLYYEIAILGAVTWPS